MMLERCWERGVGILTIPRVVGGRMHDACMRDTRSPISLSVHFAFHQFRGAIVVTLHLMKDGYPVRSAWLHVLQAAYSPDMVIDWAHTERCAGTSQTLCNQRTSKLHAISYSGSAQSIIIDEKH